MSAPPPSHSTTGEININQLLLDEVRSLRKELAELSKHVYRIDTSVAINAFKIGVWGAAGGMLPGISIIVYLIVKGII